MMPVTESSPDEGTPVQPDMLEDQQTNVLAGSPSDPTTILIEQNSNGFYQQTNATLALVLAIYGHYLRDAILRSSTNYCRQDKRSHEQVAFHRRRDCQGCVHSCPCGTIIHAFLAILGFCNFRLYSVNSIIEFF